MGGSDRPQVRVLHFAVHDPGYPRNSRIRDFLARQTAVLSVDMHLKSRDPSRVRRTLSDLCALVRRSKNIDVIVLSEFALQYAVPAMLVARARRARLVVDGFVGAYETVIGDQRQHGPKSLQAFRHRLVDLAAVRVADLFLIDTRVRAEHVRRSSRAGTSVLSLPVGAPDWVKWSKPTRTHPVRLLFYGNFLPLNGIDVILDSLAALPAEFDYELLLVGPRGGRRTAEERVISLGLAPRCTFRDSVEPPELARLLEWSHIVLGIFGASEKAKTVIPNKVWQGLAAGRPVITGHSAALAELKAVVSDQLVVVTEVSSERLAEQMVALATVTMTTQPDFVGSDEALERYVASEYRSLATWIDEAPAAPRGGKTGPSC